MIVVSITSLTKDSIVMIRRGVHQITFSSENSFLKLVSKYSQQYYGLVLNCDVLSLTALVQTSLQVLRRKKY